MDWSDLAVVVRRQGAHLGGLLRALDDARIPRAIPERGLSLTSEPATRPYVLALRWLVADEAQREELVEQLVTSDVVGLSPGGRPWPPCGPPDRRGSTAAALEIDEGLTDDELERVQVGAGDAREGVAVRGHERAGRLPAPVGRARRVPAGLVDRAVTDADARRDLDTVVTFANVVAETDASGGDKSVQAFLASLDAGEHGPGHSAWERARADAVQVLTAHGTVGREFDTVLVSGVVEGAFPSLARPEPMFDLAVLRPRHHQRRPQPRSAAGRARLFGTVVARARRRVVFTCADASARRHRRSDPVAVRRRPRIAWIPAPSGPFDEPVSTREATAAWRHRLADPPFPGGGGSPRSTGWWPCTSTPPAGGSSASGPTPAHRCTRQIRVSYSRLSNLEACELMHVLGDELGLGKPGGYHAWVGKTVHKIVEDAERGTIAKEPPALIQALKDRWRPQEFPSKAVSTAFFRLAHDHMIRNWFDNYADKPATGIERFFEFEFEGALVIGYIDRIGPGRPGRLGHHRLQDRQERQRRPAARQPAAGHLLPRGAGSRDARRVPTGAHRGTGVPARQLAQPRHRLPQVADHRSRRGRVSGADARAARRADHAQEGC